MNSGLNRLRAPGWLGHGLAALAGAVGVLGFAPAALWPAVVLSGLGLLWFTAGLAPRAAFARGFFWALGFYGVGVNWVHFSIEVFGQAPLPLALAFAVLLAAYMALYPGLVAAVLQRYFPHPSALKYGLAFPALWLAQEAFRGWFLTGFPWLFWGYSQIDGPLAGIAPVLGVYGISLGLALIVGALFWAGSRRSLLPLIPVLLLFAAAGGAGRIAWVQPKGTPLTVSLVQGNIPQEIKWNPESLAPTVEIYANLSRDQWDADLVIWPEAALPAFKHQIAETLDFFAGQAKVRGSALVLGLPTAERSESPGERPRYYNSILVLGQGGGAYHKQHLVPFGEYVPFETLLRGLIAFFDLPMSSFSAGERGVVLQTPKATLNPAVCYEIAYPLQVAELEADLLLTVSNDAWFGDTIGPHQHFEIARMRALENGRSLLRATNNGITALVDGQGRVLDRLPQFQRAVLRGQAPLYAGRTPFAASGGYPIFVLMALMLGWAWRGRAKA